MGRFNQWVLGSAKRLAMPIAVYPGIQLTGAKVRDVVTNPAAQFEAAAALHARYRTPVVLCAMDLSVEAEAFGCTVHFSDHEIPTAVSSVVASREQTRMLPVPTPGDQRTRVYLDTAHQLRALPEQPLVVGSCIGPFSLAGRLIGLTEVCGLTLTEPDLVRAVLEKCVEFLTAYLMAYKAVGADAVLMAEPAAGLLSPRGLAEFSAAPIKQIVQTVEAGEFQVILHNCGAKPVHLSAILESGPRAFHFGVPMNLVAALGKVAPTTILCGNLDPAGLFLQSTPAQVAAQTHELLTVTRDYRNFVISSGCDVPPASPLANLDIFYETVAAA